MMVTCETLGRGRAWWVQGGFSPGHQCSPQVLFLVPYQPLFTGQVSAPGATSSVFMLPIMILLNLLGSRVIYSFKGTMLDSKLQSPSLGRTDFPCLPGHGVAGSSCNHPWKLGAIQSGGRGIFTVRNVYGRNSRDCLTNPCSGSRACWVWMQVRSCIPGK